MPSLERGPLTNGRQPIWHLLPVVPEMSLITPTNYRVASACLEVTVSTSLLYWTDFIKILEALSFFLVKSWKYSQNSILMRWRTSTICPFCYKSRRPPTDIWRKNAKYATRWASWKSITIPHGRRRAVVMPPTLNINKVEVAATLNINKVLPLRLSEAGEEIGRAEVMRPPAPAPRRQQPEEEDTKNELFFEMWWS